MGAVLFVCLQLRMWTAVVADQENEAGRAGVSISVY